MFNYLRQRRRDKQLREFEMPQAEWRHLLAQPIFAGLTADEQERLRELAIWFLYDKSIFGVDDYQLTPYQKLAIAAQACLPILNLGIDSYGDWQSVVVYPTSFRRNSRYTDQHGLAHEQQEWLAGEARGDGPVLLSWPDVAQSLRGGGYNVVIHEMAHKLDMKNGNANGFPPLHDGMSQEAWTLEFKRAYLDFCRRVDSGEPVPINHYGAQNPAEFFAVLSEYFFDLPWRVRDEWPAVYALLAQFYRQSPLERLTSGSHPPQRAAS